MVASNATDGSGSRKALAPHCPRVPAHTTPRQALRKLRREPPSLRRKTRQRLRDQILHQRMAYPNGFCDLEPGPQITAHVALARGAVLGRSSRGAAASRRRSRGQRANLATIGLRVDDGSVENFSLSSKQCDPDRQIGQRLEVSRRIPDRSASAPAQAAKRAINRALPCGTGVLNDFARRPLVAARDCLAASDPDGAAIDPISTGSKIKPSLPPGSSTRARLRHVKSRLCATSCRRATSLTTAPGISVSSTIRTFSSLLHRRRRSTPRTFPSISA